MIEKKEDMENCFSVIVVELPGELFCVSSDFLTFVLVCPIQVVTLPGSVSTLEKNTSKQLFLSNLSVYLGQSIHCL